jgi:hypothetical protein
MMQLLGQSRSRGVGKGRRPARRENLAGSEQGLALLLVLILLVTASILAGAATLVWTRHYDHEARSREKAELARIDRLSRRIIRDTTFIPHPTNLLEFVASAAGESVAGAAGNRRGNPRVVLADPQLGVGPLGLGTLPYSQGTNGTVAPRNPRLLLLSSAGSPLPTNMLSGAVLDANEFGNLWNIAQGQVPADWNWNGNPEDLCIQRMQLGDLFVQVTLRYHEDESQHEGMYTLDNQPAGAVLPAVLPNGASTFTTFVIRGTYLSLYGTNGLTQLQFRDIIQDNDAIYTCRDGVWYRGMGRLGSRVGPSIRHPTPEEFADGLAAFLNPEIPLWSQNDEATKADLETAIMDFLTVGAYDNQSREMGDAQEALIDAWVAFTGAQPNKP